MHFVNSKTILSSHNGMNIYRGCTHGCIYCDSRSKCYHTPEPFEDIEVKQNAPELLEAALKKKRKKCMIGTGAMCDPYMHCEKKLELTKKCLEIIERYGFGVTVHTKSDLVLRDLELFTDINKKSKAVLQMTLTTADDELCCKIEPNVCTTSRRVEVLKIFRQAGIPCVVWLSPFLPGINNTRENFMSLLKMCEEAGVKGIINFAIGLTLREGNREYFYQKLDESFPGLKERYISHYGNSYSIMSSNNNELMNLFHDFCSQRKILHTIDECFSYLSDFPVKTDDQQLEFNIPAN